jgi:hypothetical protein
LVDARSSIVDPSAGSANAECVAARRVTAKVEIPANNMVEMRGNEGREMVVSVFIQQAVGLVSGFSSLISCTAAEYVRGQ